jgi:hypothetical protein
MNLFTHFVLGSHAQDANEPPRMVFSDNIVDICRSVPEGRLARDRCQQLLQLHALTLKGGPNEDKPGEKTIFDLRAEETTQLLGFNLGHRDGTMTFGIGTDSWESMRRSLEECHLVHNPPQTAQSVIIGWTTAMAPAFEKQQEDDLISRILNAGRETGFREINQEPIYRACDSSREKWAQLIQDTREEYTRQTGRVA